MQTPFDDLFDLAAAYLGQCGVEWRSITQLRMRMHHEACGGVGVLEREQGQSIQPGDAFRGLTDLEIEALDPLVRRPWDDSCSSAARRNHPRVRPARWS